MRKYDPKKWQVYVSDPMVRMKLRKRSRDTYARHKDKYNEYAKAYKAERRMEVIRFLGGRCVICGYSDIRALCIDHIDGGGSKERRELSSTKMFNKILRLEGKGYQLLCANCNMIKRIENGEHRK